MMQAADDVQQKFTVKGLLKNVCGGAGLSRQTACKVAAQDISLSAWRGKSRRSVIKEGKKIKVIKTGCKKQKGQAAEGQ